MGPCARRILSFTFVWGRLLYVAWPLLVVFLLGAFGRVPSALIAPTASSALWHLLGRGTWEGRSIPVEGGQR